MPGRYDILDEIGHAGMGVVYRACDRRPGRVVALKRLPKGADFQSTEARRQFECEAKTLARLDAQPAVVPVYGFGVDSGGFYIVMWYVEGKSLDAYLERHGALAAEETAQFGERLASALQYAHDEGSCTRT
jgi:serine/threonine protein kinase